MSFTFKNHYVSSFYLDQFSLQGKVQTYRTLVRDNRVPLWKSYSPAAIAHFRHLYTKVGDGTESDDLEKWFNREIETPAAKIIDAIIHDKRISKESWRVLVRFLAAQDVRTPVYFAKFLQRCNVMVPEMLEQTLEDLKRKLEDGQEIGSVDCAGTLEESLTLPHRVHVQSSTSDSSLVQVEVLGGRSMWLAEIERLLTSTWEVLTQHQWTIFMPADGLTWFTTDDPVVKLNYFSRSNYTFGGGWNSNGTEIMMPLGPKHLLFTRIGHRSPQRGHQLSFEITRLIRRMMAEHAHRFIYSQSADPFVPSTRARVVNRVTFEAEKEAAATFHKMQTDAEWDFLTRPASVLSASGK